MAAGFCGLVCAVLLFQRPAHGIAHGNVELPLEPANINADEPLLLCRLLHAGLHGVVEQVPEDDAQIRLRNRQLR